VFDDYKQQLDDQNREFNSLKTDIMIIKNDFSSGIDGVKQQLEDKLLTDINKTKNEIFEKMRQTKEQISNETGVMLVAMKSEAETGKAELKSAVSASKSKIAQDTKKLFSSVEDNAALAISAMEGQINGRFQGFNQIIEQNKRMLMDRMDEMNESTKSIARAIGLEEAAERAKQDEHIIKLFDRKIENLDKYMTAKLEKEATEIRMEVKDLFKKQEYLFDQ
jgi:hypothetical protein